MPHSQTCPVHEYFGLTCANYLVLPRTLLQSMPASWQTDFVTCLSALDAAVAHIPQADAYEVIPGEEHLVEDLTSVELTAAGITVATGDPDDNYAETTYVDANGCTIEPYQRVVIPRADPVPHYNRGRTVIDPCLPEPDSTTVPVDAIAKITQVTQHILGDGSTPTCPETLVRALTAEIRSW